MAYHATDPVAKGVEAYGIEAYAYKLIRTVDKDRLPILHSKTEMKKLIEKSGKSDEENLMAYLYKTSNSFMSVSHDYLWKDSSLESKVKRLDEIRD